MTITPLPKARAQAYTPAQPAIPPTPQVTQVYLQPSQVIPGSTWAFRLIDAAGGEHRALYPSLPSNGVTEIINGILAAFNPSPPDDLFERLIVTADYDLRVLTIVSNEYIQVQAGVFIAGGGGFWEQSLFPYALAEPVIRGAYGDALREAGQSDKAMAEEQGAVAEGPIA